MIIDVIENAKKYSPLNPFFGAAFRYLQMPAAKTLTSPRAEIDGENVFAVASRNRGKKKSEAKLETHRRYIDIHYVLQGADVMGWKPAGGCAEVLSPYDEEKDVALFNDEPLIWCSVPAGSFAIFFPDDAHAPMVSDAEVWKVILKVSVKGRI